MRVRIPPPLIVALFYLAIIIKDKSYHQKPPNNSYITELRKYLHSESYSSLPVTQNNYPNGYPNSYQHGHQNGYQKDRQNNQFNGYQNNQQKGYQNHFQNGGHHYQNGGQNGYHYNNTGSYAPSTAARRNSYGSYNVPQQTSSLNQPPSLDSRIADGTNNRHTYSIQEMRERNYESLGAREGSEGSRDARKHKFRIDSSFIGYKKGK